MGDSGAKRGRSDPENTESVTPTQLLPRGGGIRSFFVFGRAWHGNPHSFRRFLKLAVSWADKVSISRLISSRVCSRKVPDVSASFSRATGALAACN